MAAMVSVYMATTTTGLLPVSTSRTAAVAPLTVHHYRPCSLNAAGKPSMVLGGATAQLPAPTATKDRDDVAGDDLPPQPPAVDAFHPLPIPMGGRRCLAGAAGCLLLAPLMITGGPPAARGAVLEADEDVELLEKVKKDRKKRLERQGVISSSGRETGYVQELVYKLSKVGRAIDNNDLSAAGTILSPDGTAEWVHNVNAAFSKLSSSPEEKIEVDTFNTSLISLFSSGMAGARAPRDRSLLHGQASHRSSNLLEDVPKLATISHFKKLKDWPIVHPDVILNLTIAGFHVVRHLLWVQLDKSLVTALVERWRPETNTFHLRHGEMTITLQDVAMILGLRVDGNPVMAAKKIPCPDYESWEAVCLQLLGRAPNRTVMGTAGTTLQLTWLEENFKQQANNLEGADANTIMHHTRALILMMIGAGLLPDTSGNEVHLNYLLLLEDLQTCSSLSWGSAVLAFLYRQLTGATRSSRKRIGGCLHLLQLWCWEHLHVGRPAIARTIQAGHIGPIGSRWNPLITREMPKSSVIFYRNEMDVIEESQIIWQPYDAESVSRVDAICRENSELWLARVPMLCMSIVEWHLPDRVMRQFGHVQKIPPSPGNFNRKDGRGRQDVDWGLLYATEISLWQDRAESLVQPIQNVDVGAEMRRYMEWYAQFSLQFLVHHREEPPIRYYPRGGVERELIDLVYRERELLITQPDINVLQTKNQILKLQEDVLSRLRIDVPVYHPPPPPPHAEEFYTPPIRPGFTSTGPSQTPLSQIGTSSTGPSQSPISGLVDPSQALMHMLGLLNQSQNTQWSSVTAGARPPTPPPATFGQRMQQRPAILLSPPAEGVQEEEEEEEEVEPEPLRKRGKRPIRRRRH